MKVQPPRRLALLLLALTAASFGAAVVLGSLAGEMAMGDILWALAFGAFAVMGVILALKLPGNPLGWMYLSGVAAVGCGLVADQLFEASPLGMLTSVGACILVGPGLVLFPDGRVPHPVFRALLWLVVAVPIVAPESIVDPVIAAVVGVISLAALGFRFVRSDGISRRQITLPLIPIAVGMAGEVVSAMVVGPQGSNIETIFFVVLMIGTPGAMLVSILRYRLYEIDRILSRTVGYLLILGILGAVYAAGAVWLPMRLVGNQTPLFVAGSTLAAAALFNPVRHRVMARVDGRFHRTHYDPEQVADDLASRLRDQVSVVGVSADWLGAVTSAVQPAAVGVWVSETR